MTRRTRKLPQKFVDRMEKLWEAVKAEGYLDEFYDHLEKEYDIQDSQSAYEWARENPFG